MIPFANTVALTVDNGVDMLPQPGFAGRLSRGIGLTEETQSSAGLVALGVAAVAVLAVASYLVFNKPKASEQAAANTAAPQADVLEPAQSEAADVADLAATESAAPAKEAGGQAVEAVAVTSAAIDEKVAVAPEPALEGTEAPENFATTQVANSLTDSEDADSPPETGEIVDSGDAVQEDLAAATTATTSGDRAPPVFDTFRVEPSGGMVVAGRAKPGQSVDILLAGVAIERVSADATGSFVAFPFAGPSPEPRTLSLLADPDGLAIPSETSYFVAPIAEPQLAIVQPETPDAPSTPRILNPPALADAGTETTLPAETMAQVAPLAAPLPPTVLQADSGGIRVLQTGSTPGQPATGQSNVALDAITYSPDGEVQLAGRASGDGAVQVYIDNAPISISPVTRGGDWRIDLPQIDTGVYTLRIDEVDEDGAVVSRIETPFKREEPAEVAAILEEQTQVEGFEVAVRTVQPGATLWAIAEETLGEGIFYVEVFEANSDQIKDPDLIYPGQVFRLPVMPEQ